MAPRQSQSGFTLVEMLVALAIFSLLSVAGVALLQSASGTQLKVKARLAEIGGDARAIALLETDLAQAVSRPVLSATTIITPAFVARGGETPGQIFSFTRLGWSNLDASPRGEVQRVVYSLDNGALLRTGLSAVDGGQIRKATLLTNVASAKTKFRDSQGNWRSDWDTNDPLALPRAVELTVTQEDSSPLRLVFLVGNPAPVKSTPVELDTDAP